jgi:hypothetical protein
MCIFVFNPPRTLPRAREGAGIPRIKLPVETPVSTPKNCSKTPQKGDSSGKFALFQNIFNNQPGALNQVHYINCIYIAILQKTTPVKNLKLLSADYTDITACKGCRQTARTKRSNI